MKIIELKTIFNGMTIFGYVYWYPNNDSLYCEIIGSDEKHIYNTAGFGILEVNLDLIIYKLKYYDFAVDYNFKEIVNQKKDELTTHKKSF